jgi:YD repeat-containing protein
MANVVHSDGGTTEICYDAAGRRTSTLEPDGTLTTYKWGADDRIVEITRSTADARTWRLRVGHDAFGLLRRVDAADLVIGGRSVDVHGLVLLGDRTAAIANRPSVGVTSSTESAIRRPRPACRRRPR